MSRESEETAILIAQTGPLNGQRWSIRSDLLIGRDPGCDIVIPDRQVSRQHARLQVTPEGVILEDLGSKNGTFVNGEPILGAVQLHDNDVIQVTLVQAFTYFSSDSTVPLEIADTVAQLLATGSRPTPTTGGRLRLDKRSRRVWILPSHLTREVEVLPPLSASQYLLLEILYERPGEVVTRQELVSKIWGEEEAYEVSEQALDALVRRLRERLASVDPHHAYLVTVRGHGLRLDNPPRAP